MLRKRERITVVCNADCGAYEEPETLQEWKDACIHWRDHCRAKERQ